jgi:hypothetical protein
MMTWLSASSTWTVYHMLAEATAFQLTEPSPVMKCERFCFASKIFGRPML